MYVKKSPKRAAHEAQLGLLSKVPESTLQKLGTDHARVKALLAAFKGELVFPSSASYEADRQVSDPAFQFYPLVIAYCTAITDVAFILEWATLAGQTVTCRSGGHSTAGYSVNNHMVLDTSRMNSVTVDPVQKTATVGPGTDFEKLNGTLDSYHLHVPGGGCPTVCVGGYMQGGGYGFTSREFGMHCDNVKSVLVMLVDGSIVRADSTQNTDLYWSIRGGTGNNFGVLLETTYNLHDLWQICGFGLRWSLDDAPAALVAMQAGYMRKGASNRMGYMTVITLQQDNKHWLLMRGVFDGSAVQAQQALAPLLATPGAHFDIPLQRGSYYHINTLLLETAPWTIPYVPPQPANTTIKEDKQAGYIDKPVPLSHWQKVIAHYRKTPAPFNTVVLEPYGGAISAYPRYGNAFVHRNVDMDFFVDTFWVDPADQAKAVAWLDQFMALMAPFFNGEVYQNYPRRNTSNYRQAYWGAAFATLLHYKQRYNNSALLNFEQSISPDVGVAVELAPEVPYIAAAPIKVEPYSRCFAAKT